MTKYSEVWYGNFRGGDPRNFKPDLEVCTEEEIARWKAACERWDHGDHVVCPEDRCGFMANPGKPRSGFGPGTYMMTWEE